MLATSFSQFIPVNVKEILRNSKPQFREKLRKSRLRQKGFSNIKKRVIQKGHGIRKLSRLSEIGNITENILNTGITENILESFVSVIGGSLDTA